ncbi:MAG TPA: hypothetical protein DIW81_06410, partial [Planctomycetaceae bacterium]|nr:hypothetical protein [Planctomycetaceae bacterium]
MSDDEQIEDLLDQYEEAIEQGEQPDILLLCGQQPELADRLQKRIDALAKIDGMFASPESVVAQGNDGETLGLKGELTDLKFHAKGGLGAVYRAHETKVNRQVAVKFIHRNLARKVESRSRFELEAEVTGRLDHPGVVPLYGIGESDNGRMFYYM